MNGPEHYREAEKCLALVSGADESPVPPTLGECQTMIAIAQVHATLALAAALAPTVGKMRGEEDQEVEAWEAVAGVPAPEGRA